MKVIKSKHIKVVVFTLLFVFLVINLFFFTISLFNLRHRENETEGEDSKLFNYQYFQFTPEKNEVNYGILSQPLQNEEVNEKGFLTYLSNDEGTQVLISNFGEEEYQCLGSCYCEPFEEGEEIRRRSAFITSKRGVTYLLAAASSYLAYHIAFNRFEEECSSDGDFCHEGSIRSEVEECISLSDNYVGENSNQMEEEVEGYHQERQSLEFYCEGHCVSRRENVRSAYSNESPYQRRQAGDFNDPPPKVDDKYRTEKIGRGRTEKEGEKCEDIKASGHIEIEPEEIKVLEPDEVIEPGDFDAREYSQKLHDFSSQDRYFQQQQQQGQQSQYQQYYTHPRHREQKPKKKGILGLAVQKFKEKVLYPICAAAGRKILQKIGEKINEKMKETQQEMKKHHQQQQRDGDGETFYDQNDGKTKSSYTIRDGRKVYTEEKRGKNFYFKKVEIFCDGDRQNEKLEHERQRIEGDDNVHCRPVGKNRKEFGERLGKKNKKKKGLFDLFDE